MSQGLGNRKGRDVPSVCKISGPFGVKVREVSRVGRVGRSFGGLRSGVFQVETITGLSGRRTRKGSGIKRSLRVSGRSVSGRSSRVSGGQ